MRDILLFIAAFGLWYFLVIGVKYVYFRYILGYSSKVIVDEINKDQIFFRVNNSYDK